MRILLHSPKDTVAGAVAFTAVIAIVANAIFMQAGRHPSPMFGGGVTVSIAAPPIPLLPRPRPIEAEAKPAEARLPDAKPPEIKSIEIRPVEAKPVETKPVEPAHLAKTSSAPPVVSTGVIRPPAPIPPVSRSDPAGDLITPAHRVAWVQRALTEYGYGQLKPTGSVGSDTQAAIQKFERDRKLPVTGQISERLVHELTAMTGRPID